MALTPAQEKQSTSSVDSSSGVKTTQALYQTNFLSFHMFLFFGFLLNLEPLTQNFHNKNSIPNKKEKN
jgi:hypothetical protein